MTETDRCSLCGMCRTACPVFKAALTETASPRTKALLIKKLKADKIIYACTLCKACSVACPAKVKLDKEIENARREAVKQGLETEANKKMIKNIREFNNPFGKVEKGKIPKELYCC